MNGEEKIQQDLIAKFSFLDGKIRIQRPRRIWVETPPEFFESVFSHLVKNVSFPILCTITGVDEGDKFGLIYHLAQNGGVVLNLKVAVPRDKPLWKTVTRHFPGGAIYEREIMDLLGIQFEGLPPGKRYPLPDDWPAGQHPLRKDWKTPGAAAIPKEEQP